MREGTVSVAQPRMDVHDEIVHQVRAKEEEEEVEEEEQHQQAGAASYIRSCLCNMVPMNFTTV